MSRYSLISWRLSFPYRIHFIRDEAAHFTADKEIQILAYAAKDVDTLLHSDALHIQGNMNTVYTGEASSVSQGNTINRTIQNQKQDRMPP